MCSTGNPPAASRTRSITFRLSQPDRSAGCVETMISVSLGSSIAIASRTASAGSASTTRPCAVMPASRRAASVRSSRRPAAARLVSS